MELGDRQISQSQEQIFEEEKQKDTALAPVKKGHKILICFSPFPYLEAQDSAFL